MDAKGRLALDLAGPGFHLRNNKLVLESKESMGKRGVASPDDADALALTFAMPVAPRDAQTTAGRWLPAASWQA
jgi:phage terminase large subunit